MSELNLWQTAIIPSFGGFGLRFFEEYHYAAYLGSSMQSFSFLPALLFFQSMKLLV
jgi:hypothetical protein